MEWNSPVVASIVAQGRDPEEVERLYWKEGLSVPDIAERLRVTHSVIRYTMLKYNIPKRSKTDAALLAYETGRLKPLRGSQHGEWNGGRIKYPDGYVWVRIYEDNPYYSMARWNGYVAEHRLVMAQHLGRCLTKEEIVHHKNHIRDDNRIENLELFISNSRHSRMTGKELIKLRVYVTELEAEHSSLKAEVNSLRLLTGVGEASGHSC